MFLGYAVVQLPGFFFMLFGCTNNTTNTSKDCDKRNNFIHEERTPNSEPVVPVIFRYTSPPNFKEISNNVHPSY